MSVRTIPRYTLVTLSLAPNEGQTVSQAAALIPLAALVWLVKSSRALPRTPSSLAWAAFPTLLLVALALLGFAGLLEGVLTIVALAIASPTLTFCARTSLTRDELWRTRASWDAETRRKRDIIFVAVLVLLCALLIELPFTTVFIIGGPRYLWLELLLCGLLLATLYFLGQRRAVACLPAVLLFAAAGFGQHFVRRFKNSAILPTDLLVLNTAAAVTKEYVFSFNEQTVLGVTCLALVICALSLVPPPQPTEPSRAHRILRNLGSAGISLALLVALIVVPDYMGQLGIEMRYWYSINCYEEQGFLPSFIAVAQDMPIRKPDGYSDERATELEEAHAQAWRTQGAKDPSRTQAVEQFAQSQPSIVVVMNESFCDLSIYDGLHDGYEGPSFFKEGLTDALASGTLNVSVHGAGTCNSEFEFLTGNALCFVGAGKYPYSIYDLTDVDALPAQLKEIGYHTLAMHPNYASNWNRNRIYPLMGFDEYLSIDDFGGVPDPAIDTQTPNEPHCEVFHSGVSDAATYDMVLERLRTTDKPLFVFDVTMANHGSYDQNNLPQAYRMNYQPKDYVGEETPERLNEFLGCIARSDDDLRAFVAELRALSKPVVLVFFGDHQPTLSMSYNDYWYPNEPEDVHARRAFCTDYVIWTNYDVAGREQHNEKDETSLDLLAAQTLDLIGAPVSEYQAAQLDLRNHITALSTGGYQTADRTWHAATEDGPAAELYHDMSLIEYLNFATRI